MEFLLENPLILIALFAFISSFFKKKKGEQAVNQRRQPQSRQEPEEAERSAIEASVEEALKEEKRKQAERASRIEEEFRRRKQQADESMRALQNQRRAAERMANTLRETAPSSAGSQSQKQTSGRVEPQKQALVDGIIWSEILGPPRAKNPHRSIKRK